MLKQKIHSIQSDDVQARFQRLLLDHLISHGFYETALILIENEKSKKTNCDFHQFSNEINFAKKINADILNNNFETALEWCNSNSSRLKKIGSFFEFRVKLHEMMRNFEEQQKIGADHESAFLFAVEYARKNLQVPEYENLCEGDGSIGIYGDSAVVFHQKDGTICSEPSIRNSKQSDPAYINLILRQNIQECQELLNISLGMMTFNNHNKSAIDNLYTAEQIYQFSNENLQKLFQIEFSKLLKYNRNDLSIFQRICCTGLASMKTKHCKEQDRSQMFHKSQVAHLHGEINCPACNKIFTEIQKYIPTAQISTSKLRDPITGKDITDCAYVIPTTKHLYGRDSIDKILLDPQTGKLQCPITGALCDENYLKRVYIMG